MKTYKGKRISNCAECPFYEVVQYSALCKEYDNRLLSIAIPQWCRLEDYKEVEEKKGNKYQCAHCCGIYEKDWPDEEALEEHDQNFPGASHKTMVVVCDDCYKEMIKVEPPPGMKS